MADVIFAALAAFLLGYGVGIVHGDTIGTKETERRWSEAVGRADDARRTGGSL
jgi:hypothetical protein